MRTTIILAVLFAAAALVSAPAGAGEGVPSWVKTFKVHGLVYSDAYYLAASHVDDLEGANGFWFRRIYLTFDSKLSAKISTRLRFEMASPGDFRSSSTLTPFVKDAYLKARLGQHALTLGISGTPTWGLVEKHWGYRSVEKTPLDLFKWGSSRDTGVSLKGRFGDKGKVRYAFFLGNGRGNKSEGDEGKKGMLAISFHPTEALVIEAYADADDRPGSEDRQTYQIFAGYGGAWGRIGLLGARQVRGQAEGDDLTLGLASLHAIVNLGDRSALLLRYDRLFDPSPEATKISYYTFAPDVKLGLLLVGYDYKVLESFSLIPNVAWVKYDGDGADGATPDDDIMVKLTAFWTF